MYQVETFKSNDENELVRQINYFLRQLDEILVKDIKYSSVVFFNGKFQEIEYSALIIYLVK